MNLAGIATKAGGYGTRALGWAMANPTPVMAGIGAFGGYMMGGFYGAAAGGLAGGLTPSRFHGRISGALAGIPRMPMSVANAVGRGGASLAMGLGAGFASNMARAAIGTVGSTFGGGPGRGAPYGNTFSGMGNRR